MTDKWEEYIRNCNGYLFGKKIPIEEMQFCDFDKKIGFICEYKGMCYYCKNQKKAGEFCDNVPPEDELFEMQRCPHFELNEDTLQP